MFLFLTFKDIAAKKFIKIVSPEITKRPKFGLITDCTYVDLCHEAFSATNKGYIHVFGSSYYQQNFKESPIDNEKMFVKTVEIGKKAPILCLESIDGYTVNI